MEKFIYYVIGIFLMSVGISCSEESLLDKQKSDQNESAYAKDGSASARISPNAFTIVAYPKSVTTEAPVQLQLQSDEPAAIRVDWGDGVVEVMTFAPGPNSNYFIDLSHDYTDSERKVISITGDLDKIVYVDNQSYDVMNASAIELSRLRNLRSLSMGFNSFTTLDLSRNSKLESLLLYSNIALENLMLPKKHSLSLVDLSGSTALSTAEIDEIIDNIYSNSVKSNVVNGRFSFDVNAIGRTGEMIGPPSSNGLNQLRILRDEYTWMIDPDPGSI